MPELPSPGISKYSVAERHAENRIVVQADGIAHAKVLRYETVWPIEGGRAYAKILGYEAVWPKQAVCYG